MMYRKVVLMSPLNFKKEDIVNKLGDKVVVLESDFYRFMTNSKGEFVYDEKGNRIVDVEFPENMVRAVNALYFEASDLEEYKSVQYIYVDAPIRIAKLLADKQIPMVFILVNVLTGGKSIEVSAQDQTNMMDFGMEFVGLQMLNYWATSKKDALEQLNWESTYNHLSEETKYLTSK